MNHPASHKHLQKLSQQGVVRRATDFTNAIMLIAGATLLLMFTPSLIHQLKHIAAGSWQFDHLSTHQITELLPHMLLRLIPSLFGFMMVLFGIGLVVQVMMSGFRFNLQLILPKCSRLSILNYGKRLFSLRSLFAIVKVFVAYALVCGVLAVLIYQLVLADLARSMTPSESFWLLGKFSIFLLLALLSIGLVIGLMDLMMEYHRFKQQTKMSDQARRDEFRAEHVSPELRKALNQRLRLIRQQGKSS